MDDMKKDVFIWFGILLLNAFAVVLHVVNGSIVMFVVNSFGVLFSIACVHKAYAQWELNRVGVE
ncbi:MAG: hypothetical protein ACTSPB_00385 [Candidatus Thorarchaeota archaeon]